MATDKNVEVIVLSNSPLSYQNEKELLQWFKTTVQPVLDKQQANSKKKYLKNWKHTPAIYLS